MQRTLLTILSLVIAAAALTAQDNKSITSPHGFRYIAHTNKGGVKPQPSDNITVHVATFIGDSVMMDTRQMAPSGRQIEMPPAEQLQGKSVPALFDAALLMGKGDSSTIFMKIDSNIMRVLPPVLQKEKEVRYEIVLLDIVPAAEVNKAREKAQERQRMVAEKVTNTVGDYGKGLLAARLKNTPSGLKVLVEDQGKGEAIKTGEPVRVHYYGCLTNATMFDNSYQRGEPLEFSAGVGQMIPGFDEGLMLLNHGAKAYLFIPYPIGYGDQPAAGGLIPAKSELVFFIEIL